MNNHIISKVLVFAAAALVFVPSSFATPTNTCVNVGTPQDGLYPYIDCTLYYNGAPNSFNLESLMTEDGASLAANDFSAHYAVLINGNPSTLPVNSTGLYNQSLWEAVLYFPGGDPNGPESSDMLDILWPGSFPSVSTIESYNAYIFSGDPSGYFLQATGSETVIGAGTTNVFDIFTAPTSPALTPEPDSLALMATGLLGLLPLMRRSGGRKTSGK